jgi:Tol biopolymer transport system component
MSLSTRLAVFSTFNGLLLALIGCSGGGGGNGGAGGDPTPQIISLSPTSATAGGVAFTLTVTGSGFKSSAAVNWNGSPRSTTFQSASILTASITAADIASSGSASVTVVNPASFGSIISNSINFPVNSATPPPPPTANVIALVSEATDGTEGNRDSNLAAISSSGRFVAFVSLATNFTSTATNGFENVFLRDTCTAGPVGCRPSTIPVSFATDGSLGNGDSGASVGFATVPAISADGRFVAFASDATNLVANDSNASTDIFLRDTCTGAPAGCTPSTNRISVASDGTQSNGNSFNPSISEDGRFVVFDSQATNLVASDTNTATDVFLRDTCQGAPASCTPSTIRVSVASDGTQGNDASNFPGISGNGRYVAFNSAAKNLTPNDTTVFINVFVRDTCFGAAAACSPSTSRVSVGPGDVQGNEGSAFPSISADGRFIAFASFASNLVSAGVPSGIDNVFVRDTCAGAPVGCTPATTLVSASNAGLPGNAASGLPSVSASGRFIAFNSDAQNLVSGDTNGFTDVFVRDTCLGASTSCLPSTLRVSVSASGAQGNFNSSIPAISADGHFVAFGSGASNLLPNDTNASTDVFLANTSF